MAPVKPRRKYPGIQYRSAKKGARWRARVRVAGEIVVGPFRSSQSEAYADSVQLKESGKRAASTTISVFAALEAVVEDARDRGLSEATVKGDVRGTVRKLQSMWREETPLLAIDVAEVCWMVRECLETGLSPNTIRDHYLPKLSRAFHLAGLESPVPEVRKRMRAALRTRPHLRHVLCPDDVSRIVQKILAHQGSCPQARWVADVVLFLSITGMRVGEFTRMRVEDIELGDGEGPVLVRIPIPKDRSNPRTAVVPWFLRPLVARLADDAVDGAVCPMTMDHLSTTWSRWRKRIDEPILDGRSLRHAYATALHRSGTPIGIVQVALGHRNLRTTSRYVHGATHDVAPYVDELGRALLGSAESPPGRPRSPGSSEPGESPTSESRPPGPPSTEPQAGSSTRPHPEATRGGSAS